MKRLRRRLRGRGGFTLAETLVAILIMLMVSSIMAKGIPSARSAYERVVLASNAEVLLSTTISGLRNELGTAGKIELGREEGSGVDTEITYYSRTTGAASRIYVAAEEGAADGKPMILYQRYADTGLGNASSEPVRFMSAVTATADLYVTYDSVEYDEESGIITFDGLSVNRESGREGLAGRDRVSIRVMAY